MKQINLLDTNMIKLASSFSRATNLASDYTDSSKLNSIFITSKFEQEILDMLKSILDHNSNQRVKVLSGSPGLGKSTFALFAANLVSKRNPRIIKRILTTNHEASHKVLRDLFSSFQKSTKSKLLPVFLNGHMGELEDAFSEGLQSSMKYIGLEKEMNELIKFASKDQLSIIKKWSKIFPEIYNRYLQILKEKNQDRISFEKSLHKGTSLARKTFESIYSEITGGGNSLSHKKSDIIELYKKSIKILHKKKYAGIYVFYDEFGKYLERGIYNPSLFNVQFLQDFAEYCDRSEKFQCHLTLITHLSVSQYASKLPLNIQKEWAKVEGRFHESSFFDRNTNHYKMISVVFQETLEDNNTKLNTKWKKYIDSLFERFTNENIGLDRFLSMKGSKKIIRRCYPLHPVVLALLPDLCQKIAQNERTLYTFLTRDEENSLFRFISSGLPKDKLKLLAFSKLYEYFSPLITKDTGIGGHYKIQLIHEISCNKFNRNDSLAKEIISLVALISIIRDSSLSPISKEFITASLNPEYSKKEVAEKLDSLIKKRVLILNKMTEQFELIEGASINIDEEINKLKTRELTSKDLVKLLKKYIQLSYIIPNKYNFEHYVTRYYREEVISFEELLNISTNHCPNYGKEDGILYYVIPFSQDELNQSKIAIKKTKNKCVAFILPETFIECKADLEELNAVNALFGNRDVINSGPLVRKELNRHKDILTETIERIVRPILGKTFLKAICFYPHLDKQLFAKHFGQLNRFLGDLFEIEYKYSVNFNSEYINKHKISGTISFARKIVINSIINNKKQSNFGLQDYKPETAIFKALQQVAHIEIKNDRLYFSEKSSLKPCFDKYKEIISSNNRTSLENIIQIFVAPPFGIRKGILPLLIAIWDQALEEPVNHYIGQTFVKTVDSDHYDMLMKQPKLCHIQYIEISKKKKFYISQLGKAFGKKDIRKIQRLLEVIYSWRKTIPDSTKFSADMNSESKKFLVYIDSAQDPSELIFCKIPQIFGLENINENTPKNDIEEVTIALKKTKKHISTIYPKLLQVLHIQLIEAFHFLQKRCLGETPFSYSKNINLAEVFQSTLKRFKKSVINYPFSKNTSRFLGRLKKFDSNNHSQYFIETVADALTGSSPRNWNIEGQSVFEFVLSESLNEIETVAEYLHSNIEGESAIAFINKSGRDKDFIKLGAVTNLNEFLLSKSRQIEDILKDLSDKDIKNILANLLKKDIYNDNLRSERGGLSESRDII